MKDLEKHEHRAGKRRKTLLAHQRATVEYLRRHPKQHGLLINHALGSGKSRSGIAVADAFPGHDVLVLAPKHLEYVWQAEFEAYRLSSANKARYRFVAYSDVKALEKLGDLSRDLVIMDEAHHVVKLVSSFAGGAKLYGKLQRCYKIVLLTGTPLYNDEFDLPYLINLCSGKMTLPLERAEYLRTFTRVNWGASAYVGYWGALLDTFKSVATNPLLTLPLTFVPAFVDFLVPFAKVRFGGADPMAYALQRQHGLTERVFGGLWRGGVQYPSMAFRRIVRWLSGYEIQTATLKSYTILTVQLCVVAVWALNYLIARKLNADRWQLRSLDMKKLSPVLRRYVSFYERPRMAGDYARVETKETTLNYTAAQLRFFLQFCEETLSTDEIAELNDVHDRDSVELFGSQYLKGMQQHIQYGLKIGNLKLKGVWPAKFEELYKACDGGRVRSVVYSNFWRDGILRLGAFLTEKGVRHVILSDADKPATLARKVGHFNAGRNGLLLLHPQMTEGISTEGVRQVHFLEPVGQQAVREQVIARAVRYRSHAKLPARERVVTVTTYVMSLDGNGLAMHLEKLKQWHRYRREYLPGSVKVKNNYRELKSPRTKDVLLSPDVIQVQCADNFGKNVRALLAAMRDDCIERRGAEK